MPHRARPHLTPERRNALVTELRILHALKLRAERDMLVHVSRSYDAGMTVRDIAAAIDIDSGTATRWKAAGEKERERRRSEE